MINMLTAVQFSLMFQSLTLFLYSSSTILWLDSVTRVVKSLDSCAIYAGNLIQDYVFGMKKD